MKKIINLLLFLFIGLLWRLSQVSLCRCRGTFGTFEKFAFQSGNVADNRSMDHGNVDCYVSRASRLIIDLFIDLSGVLVGRPVDGSRFRYRNGHLHKMLCCSYTIVEPEQTSCLKYHPHTSPPVQYAQKETPPAGTTVGLVQCCAQFIATVTRPWWT